MEEIAKTDEGKDRIAEMGLRQDHYTAEEVEKSGRHQDQGFQGEQRVREPPDMEPSLLFPS